MNKKINIGIVAHVDAGKTTVTEHLLHLGGVIKEIGRVDSGNTQTDSMELERKRGISIKSTPVSFNWKDVKINLIDTPGHVDFVAEVERSLKVLDGAVLVISGREGIQSQTRVLFETLKKLGIPTLIFINKLDRLGCDYKKLLKDIKTQLSPEAVALQGVQNEGSKDLILGEVLSSEIIDNEVIYALGEMDKGFFDDYLNGAITSKKVIEGKIALYSMQGLVYPILCGSALSGVGIENLLDGICTYLPSSTQEADEQLSGVVFKIQRDNTKDKRVYVRMFQGKLSLRDLVEVRNKDLADKVTKIHVLREGGLSEESALCAGDIGIVYGLNNFQIGDIIGIDCNKAKSISIARPILKVKVSTAFEGDRTRLFKVLTLLSEEDPLLEIETDEIAQEIYVNLFGEVQREVLKSVLEDNYNLEVDLSESMTIYKETPRGVGTSIIPMRKRGINPFYATIGLRIEPLERGNGLVYVSEVPTGTLPKSFQNGIEDGIYSSFCQGLLGWEVTDIKVTLILGLFNSVESTPSDFRNLAPMVFMEALDNAKTYLLEPMNQFELKVDKEVMGRAISDLQRMRAVFEEPIIDGKDFIVRGTIPIESSKNYGLEISSYTEGRGVFITRFLGYQEDFLGLGKPRKKLMVDPLNKKEYLMHKMNAVRR